MGLRESLQDNISIDKKFLNIFPATNSFMLQFWEILVFVWWVSGFNPSCKGGEELCSEECAGYSHLQLHLIKWGWNINYIHILYLPRNTSRNLKNCKNILIKHHLNRGKILIIFIGDISIISEIMIQSESTRIYLNYDHYQAPNHSTIWTSPTKYKFN